MTFNLTMIAPVIDAVFPIFALILTGWLCARFKLLSTLSMEGLNKFVIYLALPSQLFYAMAHAKLTELAQPGFVLSFGISIFLTSGLQAFLSRNSKQNPIDRMIDCMTSGYSNAGFMGIPLCMMIFGPASLGPSIISTLFTVSLLFAVTIAFIELQKNKDGQVFKTLLKILLAMLRNPLLLAPLLGIALSASPWSLPTSADRYFNLLGEAATPCALISIGLFLAQSSHVSADKGVLQIVALKLLVQPIIATICVLYIFDMPKMWALVAILASALPVGTGPFMMANLYRRDASASARAILLSTILSVITISALTAWVTLAM